jgi:hypothetical protein
MPLQIKCLLRSHSRAECREPFDAKLGLIRQTRNKTPHVVLSVRRGDDQKLMKAGERTGSLGKSSHLFSANCPKM